MTGRGWRTIQVDTDAHLQLRDNQLIIETKSEENGSNTETALPLEQLRCIVVTSQRTSVTVSLLNRLAEAGISLLICDKRHNPSVEMTGINPHFEAAGYLTDQAGWSSERKDEVWRRIVSDKIRNQAAVLKHLELTPSQPLENCLTGLTAGDTTNREGMAARVYFNTLFGRDFTRDAALPCNAALNYGYTIFLNTMNRIAVVHGYNTALGIHHCSRMNRYNLSCDLIEPFRPMVDAFVYKNGTMELDWTYRKELLSLLYREIRYRNMNMQAATAMEAYALDILKSMSSCEYQAGELQIV